MKNDYSILVLCEHLEVSPSGYYDWLNRRTAPGPRALANHASPFDKGFSMTDFPFSMTDLVISLLDKGISKGDCC